MRRQTNTVNYSDDLPLAQGIQVRLSRLQLGELGGPPRPRRTAPRAACGAGSRSSGPGSEGTSALAGRAPDRAPRRSATSSATLVQPAPSAPSPPRWRSTPRARLLYGRPCPKFQSWQLLLRARGPRPATAGARCRTWPGVRLAGADQAPSGERRKLGPAGGRRRGPRSGCASHRARISLMPQPRRRRRLVSPVHGASDPRSSGPAGRPGRPPSRMGLHVNPPAGCSAQKSSSSVPRSRRSTGRRLPLEPVHQVARADHEHDDIDGLRTRGQHALSSRRVDAPARHQRRRPCSPRAPGRCRPPVPLRMCLGHRRPRCGPGPACSTRRRSLRPRAPDTELLGRAGAASLAPLSVEGSRASLHRGGEPREAPPASTPFSVRAYPGAWTYQSIPPSSASPRARTSAPARPAPDQGTRRAAGGAKDHRCRFGRPGGGGSMDGCPVSR